MGNPLYAARALRAAVATTTGAFAAFGPGADVDAAFDEAVSAAGYDYGFADLLPSITAADASDVRAAAEEPMSVDCALAAAQQHVAGTPTRADIQGSTQGDTEESDEANAAGDTEADIDSGGQPAGHMVMAWPVAAPAAHSRRRVRVVLDDPDLELPTSDGVVLSPSAALVDALAAAGAAAGDGEVLERVELKVRARFRPVVTVNRGASQNGFAVLDPASNTLVSTGHKTSGEARREAVATLKAQPVSDLSCPDLHVVKLVGRAGGLPLISVRRTRVAQKATARVVFAAPKKPGATKTVGWLFAGVLTR